MKRFLVLLVLCIGCGETHITTPSSFCFDFSSILCERSMTCGIPTQENCFLAVSEDYDCAGLTEAIVCPEQTFAIENADQCVVDIEDMPCAEFEAFLTDEGFEAVYSCSHLCK